MVKKQTIVAIVLLLSGCDGGSDGGGGPVDDPAQNISSELVHSSSLVIAPDYGSSDYIAAVEIAPSKRPEHFGILRDRIVRVRHSAIAEFTQGLLEDPQQDGLTLGIDLFPEVVCEIHGGKVGESRPGYFNLMSECGDQYAYSEVFINFAPDQNHLAVRVVGKEHYFQLVPLNYDYALVYEYDRSTLPDNQF